MGKAHKKKRGKTHIIILVIINILLLIPIIFAIFYDYVVIDASFGISIFGAGKYLSLTDNESRIQFVKNQYYKLIISICIYAFILMITNYVYVLIHIIKQKSDKIIDEKHRSIYLIGIISIVLNTAVALIVSMICVHQINDCVSSDILYSEQIPKLLCSCYQVLIYLIPIFLSELIFIIVLALKKHTNVLGANLLFSALLPLFMPFLILCPYI